MEKNKTAMKQMIEYLEELQSKTIDISESYMLTSIWTQAVILMAEEKLQIKEAISAGNRMKFEGIFVKKAAADKFAEEYYNKKYMKNQEEG